MGENMPGRNNGRNELGARDGRASSGIVLPDGTPYSLNQIREKINGSNGRRILDAVQETYAGPQSIDFKVFPDGTLVDLVRDPDDPDQPSLLVFKDGAVTIQKEFHCPGKKFLPRSLDPSLFVAVGLPTGIVPCGNARQLLGELEECIVQYVDLAREHQHLVCTALMYTWFQDQLPVAPYLWLIGPHGSGKTTLLALMQCLCRRAVMVGDLTPASLYALPNAIMPTLMIDEFEAGRGKRDIGLLRLLRTGSTQSGRIVRGKKLYGTFCAKIIASRQMPDDAALASRAIFIPMLPTRRTLPPLDRTALESIAAHFQPKLLAYRLQSYNRVLGRSILQVPDFTPRMKDLARMLAAPLLGDEQLEKELFDALAKQDRAAKLERYGEPEWAVALALYEECHRTTGTITVGALSGTADRVLYENGETYPLKPRAVGNIVRSLGLDTEQLGNQGRGLRLTARVIDTIHAIAQGFGLKRSDLLPIITTDSGYGGPPCALCEKHGLMVREDGTHLRCIEVYNRPRRSKLYD